jgi:DNA-binding transcriptional LysR family regulator
VNHVLLRDLDYFLGIAEGASQRRIAALAGVSQPAVAKGLKRLESQLGLTLVQRSRHGAVLTEAGRSFVIRARRLRNEIEAAAQEANDLRARSQGLVRVGSTPALVDPKLTSACLTLMNQRPSTSFRVQIALSDELLTALRRGDLDMMLSGKPDPVPVDLNATPIGENLLGVVAREGHPIFKKRRPHLSDLVRHAWMLPRRGVLSRDWLDAVFAAHDLPRPVTRLEFDPDHDALVSIVLNSDLLSVAGESLHRKLKSKGLVMLEIDAVLWRRPIVALTRVQSQLTPIAERFIEVLSASPD